MLTSLNFVSIQCNRRDRLVVLCWVKNVPMMSISRLAFSLLVWEAAFIWWGVASHTSNDDRRERTRASHPEPAPTCQPSRISPSCLGEPKDPNIQLQTQESPGARITEGWLPYTYSVGYRVIHKKTPEKCFLHLVGLEWFVANSGPTEGRISFPFSQSEIFTCKT